MSKIVKLFKTVCSGQSDHNIKFSDLQSLLVVLGFELVRIRGDHFIFAKADIPEIINIQPNKTDSSKAKSVQVKQIRELIKKYKLEVIT